MSYFGSCSIFAIAIVPSQTRILENILPGRYWQI
jgi:hypothetical protein